jgi:hypothetical protein
MGRLIDVPWAFFILGVVMPIRPPVIGAASTRRASGTLSKQADWRIDYLLDEQLSIAQLPNVVLTKEKPACKPRHWYSK